MICVDSSVVVAAFAAWHEEHGRAMSLIGRDPHLPAHCLLEVYSTLTRLPAPFRAPAEVVADYLRRQFTDRVITPAEATVTGLPRRLATAGLVGGIVYDALIGVTAADAGGELHTLDRRAARAYGLLQVPFVLV